MLLRYFDWRSSILRQASALTLWIAAVLAPLLSMVIFWGMVRLMLLKRVSVAIVNRYDHPVSNLLDT